MNLPGQLHHVGWATARAADAIPVLVGLGYAPDPALPDCADSEFGVDLKFFARPGDPVLVELVSPHRSDSVVSRMIERAGPGPYHLGYCVTDLAAAAAEMQRLGFRAVTPRRPAPALAGRDIQFFRHPAAGLVELIQSPP